MGQPKQNLSYQYPGGMLESVFLVCLQKRQCMSDQKEFARRRQQLLADVGPDGMGILVNGSEVKRNGDAYYPFRSDSDFYYMTGFKEPEAVAVFMPGREAGQYILFCREKDPAAEIWTGARVGQQAACDEYGADQAFALSALSVELPKLLENRCQVHYALGKDKRFDAQLMQWINELRGQVRSGVHAPDEFSDIQKLIHPMRRIKSAAEVALMRRAAEVSAAAHKRVIKACRPGMHEYELEAEFVHECKRQGCLHQAYNPIVGSGANSCVLHYDANDQELEDGELLLVDAGAECSYYAADVTRTVPINGQFSDSQRAVYEVVLNAQQAVIEQIKPGVPWDELQNRSEYEITRGLVDLGLLEGDVDQLIADKAFKRFYMHRIGHWLGLDVHDVGEYKVNSHWQRLEPGMVLTVEPGIYIQEDEKIDKKWWRIGVRIEDDVLVTHDGCDVLSQHVPKTVKEIEELMSTEDI